MSENNQMPVVVLAGNPNVGKSTIFNFLTGLNQHTGNWAGKTVELASGICRASEKPIKIVDIPGTYSLLAHSREEEVARDFICFDKPDAVVVVCDATSLERNMNLVLQTMELHKKVIVCVNLMDEAKRKGIMVDLKMLSCLLGVPVVGTSAKSKRTLSRLVCTIQDVLNNSETNPHLTVEYPREIERSVSAVEREIKNISADINPSWLSLRLLEGDASLEKSVSEHISDNLLQNPAVFTAIYSELERLKARGIDRDRIKDLTVSSIVSAARTLCGQTVTYSKGKYSKFDLSLDRFFTGRITGYPVMLLLLGLILWVTVSGANFISGYLSSFFTLSEGWLNDFCVWVRLPDFIRSALCEGVFRVLGWVVSVMLPPMAIFFPLFTILEDSGYLPRIAFNLDKPFLKCNACGKQALTMCMGLGCNAVGVTGCRIIDSPRERLLAVLTNSFVPCNGRLPHHFLMENLCLKISLIFSISLGTASGDIPDKCRSAAAIM